MTAICGSFPARMTLPLIGISTSELRTPDRVQRDLEAEPPQRELALGLDYPASVASAGGVPVVLPPNADDALALIERMDGLLLSGGPDLDPALYATAPIPELGPIEPATDRWELALLQAALKRQIPVLAVCRGMQLLNVAYGGSLWQDIPSELGVGMSHRQLPRGSVTTHDVEVAPETRLAEIVGPGPLPVNSFHHQAVRMLGVGLTVTALAPDEIVEGIEDPALPFVVGVQWHAESLQGRHPLLFAALVNASREA
jgi:putative glutamine amidotransferase